MPKKLKIQCFKNLKDSSYHLKCAKLRKLGNLRLLFANKRVDTVTRLNDRDAPHVSELGDFFGVTSPQVLPQVTSSLSHPAPGGARTPLPPSQHPSLASWLRAARTQLSSAHLERRSVDEAASEGVSFYHQYILVSPTPALQHRSVGERRLVHV